MKQFFAALRQPYAALLNFALPPRCGLCGVAVDSAGALCPTCWQEISFINAPFCACCGVPFSVGTDQNKDMLLCTACLTDPPPYTMARAPLAYGQAAAKLVSRFKYSAQLWLLPVFLPWLERAAPDLLQGVDILIPVPLHRWRLVWRGYNQAALFSRALSRSTGIPTDLWALTRPLATRPQVGLHRSERLKNVQNAFEATPAHVAGKVVVLVDDVLTTGATLTACCDALLRAGAREVRVLTLARVVVSD